MTANQTSSLSPDPAIRIQGLTKRFGTLTAVDHLDLEVASGEAFALVGPDAAGKTTTMRMLVGIMDPDDGQAQVLGFDTVKDSEALKEQIGYMPQRFGLYDDLTVTENLVFYADIYRVSRKERDQRMPQLLGFSNLTPFQDRLASNLSGGMRQKLGLACALIHTPRLLFLDEPTFGVDPISRREFWEILYRLLGTGLTIFLSTAYMDEAERAHRVGLMHNGRLLMVDSPKTIKSSFQGQLLQARASNLWTARKVLGDHPLARQTLAMGDRLMITVDDAAAAAGPLQKVLEEAGLTDISMERAAPNLEDLFVQVVRRDEKTEGEKGKRRKGEKGRD
ncbi:MAG: ABC transporter ATP-binding protein [Desulfobaccales bacterium]